MAPALLRRVIPKHPKHGIEDVEPVDDPSFLPPMRQLNGTYKGGGGSSELPLARRGRAVTPELVEQAKTRRRRASIEQMEDIHKDTERRNMKPAESSSLDIGSQDLIPLKTRPTRGRRASTSDALTNVSASEVVKKESTEGGAPKKIKKKKVKADDPSAWVPPPQPTLTNPMKSDGTDLGQHLQKHLDSKVNSKGFQSGDEKSIFSTDSKRSTATRKKQRMRKPPSEGIEMARESSLSPTRVKGTRKVVRAPISPTLSHGERAHESSLSPTRVVGTRKVVRPPPGTPTLSTAGSSISSLSPTRVNGIRTVAHSPGNLARTRACQSSLSPASAKGTRRVVRAPIVAPTLFDDSSFSASSARPPVRRVPKRTTSSDSVISELSMSSQVGPAHGQHMPNHAGSSQVGPAYGQHMPNHAGSSQVGPAYGQHMPNHAGPSYGQSGPPARPFILPRSQLSSKSIRSEPPRPPSRRLSSDEISLISEMSRSSQRTPGASRRVKKRDVDPFAQSPLNSANSTGHLFEECNSVPDSLKWPPASPAKSPRPAVAHINRSRPAPPVRSPSGNHVLQRIPQQTSSRSRPEQPLSPLKINRPKVPAAREGEGQELVRKSVVKMSNGATVRTTIIKKRVKKQKTPKAAR